MIPIKDTRGLPIDNAYKDSLGAISVKDDVEYRKYMFAKKQSERINKMSKDIEELQKLVFELAEKINANDNFKNS